MKKIIVGTVLLASVIGVGVSFAGQGHGRNHSGSGMGQGQGCAMGGMYNDEMKTFHNENTPLFKKVVEKRAELQALTKAMNPDIEKVGKVAGELFDSKMEIHDAAMKSGVKAPVHGKRHGNNIDEATLAKLNDFNKANRAIKKQLAVKQAERRALLNMDSPSPEQAKSLAGEIFDLRATLSVNAEKAGLPVQLACAGMGGERVDRHQNGKHRGDMGDNSRGKGRHNGGHWN